MRYVCVNLAIIDNIIIDMYIYICIKILLTIYNMLYINNLTANRVTWISHYKHIACSPSDVSKSLNFASIMTSLA